MEPSQSPNQTIYKTLQKKKNVFICGNGGSAAEAQHLSTEFLIRLNPKINRKSLPLINLCMDQANITACGNDFGFKYIFSRNLEATTNASPASIGVTFPSAIRVLLIADITLLITGCETMI